MVCGVEIAFAFLIHLLQTGVSSIDADTEGRRLGVFGPYGAISQTYELMKFAFVAASMVEPLYAVFTPVYLGKLHENNSDNGTPRGSSFGFCARRGWGKRSTRRK